MRRIDELMSHYKPASQLSKINAHAAQEPVQVDPELFDLIKLSTHFSEITEGAFDITYASVGYLYDFRRHVKPTEAEIKAALPAINWRNMLLDEQHQTIRHPDDPNKVVTRIPLSDTAMSTSGDYERYFDENGVRYHHIIDPRTGHSASKVRSATILAPTATQTDGMSKTAFILGPEKALEIINRMPEYDAVFVCPDGRVLYSNGLRPPAPRPEGSSKPEMSKRAPNTSAVRPHREGGN
jgi:thiamine biosynthesis lipoprotein